MLFFIFLNIISYYYHYYYYKKEYILKFFFLFYFFNLKFKKFLSFFFHSFVVVQIIKNKILDVEIYSHLFFCSFF